MTAPPPPLDPATPGQPLGPDPTTTRLRLSETHLHALDAIVHGEAVPVKLQGRLVDAGLVDTDGTMADDVAAMAHTAAHPSSVLTMQRAGGGASSRTAVRSGIHGLLVAPVHPDQDEVRDIAFRPVISLARTLLSLLSWQPVEPALTEPVETTFDAVSELAGASDPSTTDLGARLAITHCVLYRIVVTEGLRAGNAIVVINLGPLGWVKVRRHADNAVMVPLSGDRLLAHLASVQAGFVHTAVTGDGPATPSPDHTKEDRAVRQVDLDEVGVALDVPGNWEAVEVGAPEVVFAARQASAEWFRVNLTVTLDPVDGIDDPLELAETTAAILDDPIVVRACEHPDEGVLTVLVHRMDGLDLVVTQRIIAVPAGHVTASWTWAVEQEPRWRQGGATLLDSFHRGPPA